MPVSYTKSGGAGHVYQVPDYPETADGPKAFKDFADYLEFLLPPIGSITPFVGNTAPAGWLLCQGQTVSSTTYPKLSAECGTKFGTAPAGQFRLPDLKGRVIAGLDSGQTEFDTIGKTGGAKSVTLTVSNMPAHDHTATISGLTLSGAATGAGTPHSHGVGTFAVTAGEGAHVHTGSTAGTNIVTDVTGNRNGRATGSVQTVESITISQSSQSILTSPIGSTLDGKHSHTFSGTSAAESTHTHSISGTISGGTVTVANNGSGTAVNTMNPYLTLNYIIRADRIPT